MLEQVRRCKDVIAPVQNAFGSRVTGVLGWRSAQEVGALLVLTLYWGARQEHTWPWNAARTSCEVLGESL